MAGFPDWISLDYIISEYIFKHTDMPDTDNEMMAWCYPFPVLAIQDSTPPVTPEQTAYLFCKTWKARLWGRRSYSPGYVDLYNSSNREVGYLCLHNEESQAPFPDTGREGRDGLPVELVIVYKSRKYSVYDEDLEGKNWCTVLWIEWEDGVAYRLASGHVKAEDWEKLDTESVDIVLG